MFTHLYQRQYFKEAEVRVYGGEIVLALEHLHKVRGGLASGCSLGTALRLIRGFLFQGWPAPPGRVSFWKGLSSKQELRLIFTGLPQVVTSDLSPQGL